MEKISTKFRTFREKRLENLLKESFVLNIAIIGIWFLISSLIKSDINQTSSIINNSIIISMACFGAYSFMTRVYFDDKREEIIKKHVTIAMLSLRNLVIGSLILIILFPSIFFEFTDFFVSSYDMLSHFQKTGIETVDNFLSILELILAFFSVYLMTFLLIFVFEETGSVQKGIGNQELNND